MRSCIDTTKRKKRIKSKESLFLKEKIPNILTVSRFFLAFLVVIFLVIGKIKSQEKFYLGVTYLDFAAAVLFLVSSFTDYLDGYLSRK